VLRDAHDVDQLRENNVDDIRIELPNTAFCVASKTNVCGHSQRDTHRKEHLAEKGGHKLRAEKINDGRVAHNGLIALKKTPVL